MKTAIQKIKCWLGFHNPIIFYWGEPMMAECEHCGEIYPVATQEIR